MAPFIQYFGKHSLHFCPTFGNDLIDPLFCNIINIVCCSFDNTRCNLSSFINCVSTWINKVITIKKTSTLPFCIFSLYCIVFNNKVFFFLFFAVSCLNFKCSGSMTTNPKGLSFLISSVSS